MRTHTYTVALALSLSACAPTHSALPETTCAPFAASTQGWPRVDFGPFSMQVPPGFERVEVQAIDSRAGAYRSENGAEITYDYGWYSNDLATDANVLTEDVRCSENIGGLPAMIVIGERNEASGVAGHYVVAAAWRNVEPGDQPVHLTVWSATPDLAQIPMLREVLYSVCFER